MKEYEFELKLKVAQCWIDDGFVGDSKEVIELIKEGIYTTMLPHAIQDVEFIVEVKPKDMLTKSNNHQTKQELEK